MPNEQNTLIGIWVMLIIILIVVVFIIGMLVKMTRDEWTSVEGKRKKARTDKLISD